MKKSLKDISVKDLASLVSSRLKKYSIDAVLTGGACVSIYSHNKYMSFDLDFVTHEPQRAGKAIKHAMEEIGFKLSPQAFFSNPECKYIIEFIPEPLSVGKEPVKEIRSIKTKLGTLKMLGPTDCVKDRLAAYYHWDDPQSLEQAVMVALNNKIDIAEIKRWSAVESNENKFNTFVKRLKKNT